MRLIRLALVVALLAMGARLVDVQVIHSGQYAAEGRGESAITVSLPSLRGGIYDRDGSPLALSEATDDVVADDFQVAHPVTTALALSPLLHVPAATLAAELHRHSGYVVLARQLSQSSAQKISADAYPGVSLIGDSKRVGTNGNLAAPLLGFTNAAGAGCAPGPPVSSTATTTCSRGRLGRRPSSSHLRASPCRSHRSPIVWRARPGRALS